MVSKAGVVLCALTKKTDTASGLCKFYALFFPGKELDLEPPKGFDNVFLVRVSILIFYSPFLPFMNKIKAF